MSGGRVGGGGNRLPACCAGTLTICRGARSDERGNTIQLKPLTQQEQSMSLKALVATGTKVWSDSVDPDVIKTARAKGITGATSNPIIIADIIKKGGLDQRISQLIEQEGSDDASIAWTLDDELVKAAQKEFMPVWEQTKGNDGYVSFELDPLIEDPNGNIPHAERVRRYTELGKKWAAG